MPKEEWGVKRICPTTGRRFYDLGKTPIISPYTGETVVLDANTRTRVAVAEVVAVKEKTTEDDSENTDLLDDGDTQDASVSEELLDDEEDDTVSLDDIADVSAKEEES
ncbi:MAG: TIGR02300 family protein [Paracoccaceae bacterium]